jgi:dephospho-CoA kinase
MGIIGLTGMSGSGKSTVASLFAESESDTYRVIDCDAVARGVIGSPPCIDEVRAAFPQIFTNGSFDRKQAAKFLFSDPEKLARYQRIVFPYVTYAILQEVNLAHRESKHAFLDAPTLYQSGFDDFCLQVIAVVADRAACIGRIMARDSISEQAAVMRLNNQPDEAFFRENADCVIENNGELPDFRKEVQTWLRKAHSSKI